MKTLKPNFKTYPQTNRLFALNKIAIEHCKQDFPDCYHFKKVLAEECTELADRLKMGLVLMAELKANGTTLTSDQNTQFKAFRNGAKYLLYTLLTWIKANLSRHPTSRLNKRTKHYIKAGK
ncbi:MULTISPECIES: hypothetical protein [Mannheimia]|uniref:hypothetical protein n=1 Tax=Mannheimia TaxID=75984 RepID=UPI001EE32B95|nr:MULTISPECIES: hypothetical protein [Mannheimia]